MNTIKVNVNFKNRTIYKSGVDLTSGDYNSTKLVFEFDRQDGRKVFEMKDLDGNLVLLTDIENNEVELVGKDENGNNASLFKQEGNYIFEVSLYDGDSKLTSAFDFIKVKQEQVEIDGEVITPYLPIFDELVNDVENIKKIIETGEITGGGTITDVRVDGVSVATNGIANIELRQTIIDILVEYGLIKLENLTEEQIQALNQMVCEINENGELNITYDETILDLDFQIENSNLIINNNINANFSINENGELEVNYE